MLACDHTKLMNIVNILLDQNANTFIAGLLPHYCQHLGQSTTGPISTLPQCVSIAADCRPHLVSVHRLQQNSQKETLNSSICFNLPA